MIKNIALLFILLCYGQVTHAGWWKSAKQCVSDPCNCGYSNIKVYEKWDGETLNNGKKNKNCPPYNKDAGRKDNICLVKKHFPKAKTGYYENLCGEEVSESNYFAPKIRLRGQQCNAGVCWTTSSTLRWNGECVTLASGYGFPLHRMCARIALPQDTIREISADPGYTQGVHLNFEGATKIDEPIYSATGEVLTFDAPKLCLYKDPSFLSINGGYDVMDLDPHHQPFHKTAEESDIVQILKFFVKIQTVTGVDAPYQLFLTLFKLIDNAEDADTTFGSTMVDMLSFVYKIFKWVESDLVFKFLDQIGQINRVVEGTTYGCVNIPFGPYPPPFCEIVSPFSQVATVQKICAKDSAGNVIKSTEGSPCVISTLDNNFVSNAVRVGYETLVPLCKNGEDPMTTDTCVVIENLDAFSAASVVHTSTAYRDLIKHCDSAAPGRPCIRTMLPHTCNIVDNGCQDGFRIVYGKQLGDTLTPQSYFYDNLTDCSGSSESVCQAIWGVNLGEFVDTNLTFPSIQEPTDIAPLSKTFDLVDKDGNVVNFLTSITRTASFNSIYNFTQEPNQLCVFYDRFVVGCVDRIPPSKTQIYDCSTGFAGIGCTTSYFTPAFIASYSENGYSTSALVEPLSVYNEGTTNLNTSINLAGNTLESFVTDNSFITKPFTGLQAPNPSSLFGTYQDDILPLDGNEVNDNAVYLTGLEYINGAYHVGGTNVCLEQVNATKCPDDVTSCVLAKLLEKDTVACSDFLSKATLYGALSVCESDISSCTVIDSISKITGGNINILNCGDLGICYDNAGVELCKISQAPGDRIYPEASLGDTLAQDKYYDPSSASPGTDTTGGYAVNYNTDEFGIRSKTSIELGLCTTIPPGICAKQANYLEDDGYAFWPQATVGEIANGSCRSGWKVKDSSAPLRRRCIPDSETQTFKFEPLYRIDPDGKKVYTNVQCIEEITTPPAGPIPIDGGATTQ